MRRVLFTLVWIVANLLDSIQIKIQFRKNWQLDRWEPYSMQLSGFHQQNTPSAFRFQGFRPAIEIILPMVGQRTTVDEDR